MAVAYFVDFACDEPFRHLPKIMCNFAGILQNCVPVGVFAIAVPCQFAILSAECVPSYYVLQ